MKSYTPDPGKVEFPDQGKGTYILILPVVVAVRLTIGMLGTFEFRAGWYAYVGSAFGAGGLRGRLKHHLAPVRTPHWHVDYLRQYAKVNAVEVWYAADAMPREHEWATILLTLPGARNPAPRFGASDCACQTHLVHFADFPDFAVFARFVTAIQR